MPTETSIVWSRWKPSRIDLYLLTEVIPPFFGGVFFFLFIFLMFQALRLAELFIVHGISFFILLKLTFYLSLTFMSSAIPISFLFAILIGFGRFSSDSELIAMKAHGLSLWRLSVPLLFFAASVGAVSIALNQNWVPWAQAAFNKTIIKVSNTKATASLREGTFTSGFFDLLIFADKIDPKTNVMNKVFIYDEREPEHPVTVVAKKGEILPVKTNTELGVASLLRLYRGDIHSRADGGDIYQKIGFGEYKLYLKIDEGAADTNVYTPMIPQDELVKKLTPENPGFWYWRELKGEYWRRYATAITPLLFVFLGMGFGTIRARAIKSGAALIAMIVLFGYWVIQTEATARIYLGHVSPFWGMQWPNLFVLVLAMIGFKRALW